MNRRTGRRNARIGRCTYGWLVLALLLAASGGGSAQEQTLVAPLGTIDANTANVDQTEFVLDAPAGRVESIAARHNFTVIRALNGRGHGVFLVRSSGALSKDELIKRLAGDTEVGHFELNGLAIAPEVPTGIQLNQSPVSILDALTDRTIVDYFGRPTWSRYVNQPAAAVIRTADTHNSFATGAGIVAIIDTGVDPNHPLLQGSLVPGYDFVNETAGPASEWTDLDPTTAATLSQSPVSILDQSPVSILDSAAVVVTLNQSTIAVLGQGTAQALNPASLPPAFGHGTMVAGLVHLVAPTAKIMPLKAFRADGSSRVFDIVRAIHYAVDNGARVINMSFSTAAPSPEITHAINQATDSGVICVSSAGNSGKDLLVYPAALRSVMGIGSTTSTPTPVRSSFSNYGNSLVRLGAPGEGVITTYPGNHYVAAWGTSFSTPLVAGAAALLLQRNPDIEAGEVTDYLSKADKMPAAGMGRGRLNLYEAVSRLPDDTPPAIAFVTPNAASALRNTIAVNVSASDNLSVTSVRFLVDNAILGPDDTAPPYEVAWDTTAVANGSYTLTAIARDGSGNATSATLGVTVANDTTAPAVAVTGPAAGASLSGTVAVTASATDDFAVASVQFLVDGVALGAADVAAPYEATWSTLAVPNGVHTLTAVALDTAGNVATSASLSVTVANDTTAPGVAVTSPAAGASLSGTATVTASATDDVAVASVQFLVDGVPLGAADVAAPYEATWSTLAVPNGLHTLTAVALDTAGNVATSASLSVTVANDTTAPAVAVTSPASGASLSGTATVTASATDDFAVASVQFLVDGVALGAADVAAPYAATWSTLAVPNGPHTLTAVARDTAGNVATSASLSVTVANDTTAPVVAVTSPSAGARVDEDSINVRASATDDIAVASVQFLIDGVPLGAPDTTAPYEVNWYTSGFANGTHTLTAVARDAAGNEATSASVAVTVAHNDDDTTPVWTVASLPAGDWLSGSADVMGPTDDSAVGGVALGADGAWSAVAASATDTNPEGRLLWSSSTPLNRFEGQSPLRG